MAEENDSLVRQMRDARKLELGRRTYYQGQLWDKDVVVVFSHWGKVAAASTCAVLITHFKVSEIIFTGVAGAVDRSLNVGDIVVGTDLYQHDMDARPIIKRHEIPLLGKAAMASDLPRRELLMQAAIRFLSSQLADSLSAESIERFSLHAPKAIQGAIASGDQFISSEAHVADIGKRLPDVLCIEMEGGAVAQVCAEFDIPFSIVRTISDAANEQAGVDFPQFVKQVAQLYSLGIIKNLLTN